VRSDEFSPITRLVREKFYLLFECTPCYAERCSLWPFVSQMAARGIKWAQHIWEGALCAALNFSAHNSNIVFELASIWVGMEKRRESLKGKVHRVKNHMGIWTTLGLNVVKVLHRLCFAEHVLNSWKKRINYKSVLNSSLNKIELLSKLNNIPELKVNIVEVDSYSVPEHIPRAFLV
jgi:hypothetical protein